MSDFFKPQVIKKKEEIITFDNEIQRPKTEAFVVSYHSPSGAKTQLDEQFFEQLSKNSSLGGVDAIDVAANIIAQKEVSSARRSFFIGLFFPPIWFFHFVFQTNQSQILTNSSKIHQVVQHQIQKFSKYSSIMVGKGQPFRIFCSYFDGLRPANVFGLFWSSCCFAGRHSSSVIYIINLIV